MVNVQFNKRLAASFGTAEVVMIATVASELGRNILKYGGGRGHLLVTWFEDATGRGGGVEIKAVDQGPGFFDTDAALSRIIILLAARLGSVCRARRGSWTPLRSNPNQASGAIVTAKKWVKPRGK